VLAPATPAGYKPIASAKVIDGVIRAYPALANGVLYLRNENKLIALR
jgi:hypothetical protein